MKPRHHLYLDDDVSERLDALARRPGTSKSAIVSDALRAYLARQATEELHPVIKASYDKVVRGLGRIERDQQVVLESLAVFVLYILTVTPPLPESQQAAARAVGQERFQRFVEQVGRRLAAGRTITRDVLARITADEVIDADGEPLT